MCAGARTACHDGGDVAGGALERTFPYLLRGPAIERSNHVWALDITYLPMARGWVYLVAVLDGSTVRIRSTASGRRVHGSVCL